MCSSHLFGLVWQLNIGLLNDGHNNGLNSGAEWGGGQPNHLLVEFIVDPPKRCWPSMKVGGLRPIVGAFLYFTSENGFAGE